MVAAHTYAELTGAVLIHPFDHPDVIAGRGTVALEILEQCPDVKTIITGVGGGGLISGMAVAVKALRPDVRIIGVQAAGAARSRPRWRPGNRSGCPSSPPSRTASLSAGRGDHLHPRAQAGRRDRHGLRGGHLPALLMLLERGKQVVEPAGAVGVAALLAGVVEVETPVVAVLSGGNIDPLLMMRVIEHGLAAAGRYLRVTVRCSDRPGQLASLLSQIAEHRANVVDVEHQRANPHLGLGEVEVALSVETRGVEHSDTLISALRASGYQVVFAAEA
ncbi:pyridoxal-phosphate dependent enzyme [Micromonospora sp. M12]